MNFGFSILRQSSERALSMSKGQVLDFGLGTENEKTHE
jgi:hypothetical protein